MSDAKTGQTVQCPRCQDAVTIPADEGVSDKRRLGKYTMQKKIGEGGMGSVYLAEQDGLGRLVALKVLPKKMTKNPVQLERFKREAHAAGVLNHPNMVMVYEFGEDRGYYFFSMEFIDGENLMDRIRGNRILPIHEAVRIALSVAEALNYAWNRSQIIHRDIKPANILLTKDNLVKVADLGLAKSIEEDTSVTREGAAIGTPAFMAPEQARGARDVDCRADIYSLGITLYRAISGTIPYKGDTSLAVMMAHTEQPLPDARELNPEIPDDLWAVLQKMVAKNPEERYQNYDGLLKDLKAVDDGRAPTNTTIIRAAAVARDATFDSTVPDQNGEDDQLTIDSDAPASLPLARTPVTHSPVQIGILGFLCMAAVVLGYSLLNRLTTEPAEPDPENLGISEIVDTKKKKTEEEERRFESLTDGQPDEVPDAAALLAKEELEEIKKLVSENPDRIEEAIVRFRALEDDPKLGREARSERSRLEKRRAKIVASQFAQLYTRVTTHLKAGEFAQATADINNLAGIPEPLQKYVSSKSISFLRRRVSEAAVLKHKRVRSDAFKLASEGKFDEARLAIKKLAELGLDSGSNSLAGDINRIDQMEARAKEAARKELDAAFQVAANKVMPFVKKRDYTGARQASAKMAQDPVFAPLKKRLKDAEEDLRRAEAGYNLILKALATNIGKYVELGRHKGRLAGIRDGRFVMKEDRVEFSPMRVTDLSMPELMKLAERGLRTASGDELLQLAFFWRFEGDQNLSREMLEQARLDGVDTQPVMDRFIPVLVVNSSPPGAQIRVFAYPPGVSGSRLTGLSARPTRMSPSRFFLQPNTIAEVLITKSGYRFETRTVELGPLGEHEIEVKLEPAGLPDEMKGTFERMTSSKDAYGNSVKIGIDSALGLPREILHKKTGTHMMLIRPGLFKMGATNVKDAGPVHSVLVSRPFYLGKYETTRGQFRAFVEARNYRVVHARKYIHTGLAWMRDPRKIARYSWQDPAYEQTDRHPVVIVNRRDVAEYLSWANSGLASLQLPTEAQWEYACRAGSTSAYFWGGAPNQAGQFANALDRTAQKKLGSRSGRALQTNDGFVQTGPVGSLKSNAFGIYDIIGNVSEYCSDVFDPSYYSRSPLKDPGGPPYPTGKSRNSVRLTDRGGSWAASAEYLTSAKRMSGDRYFCSNLSGFRVAVNVPR